MTHYSEPRTHNDANDPHGYRMHDVIEPPELSGLVDQLERENIVYHRGTRYIIDEFMALKTSDGTMYARLRPYYEIAELSDEPIDLTDAPF